MPFASVIHVLLALLLAPLLPGVINRVKAFFAGRRGQPLLQPYHDILKLLRKGAVYSRTTSWVFRAGPVLGLAAAMVSLTVLPLGGSPAVLAFPGDLLLFAYLLGLMRFVTMTGRPGHRLRVRGHGGQPRGLVLRRWPSRPCCSAWRLWRCTPAAFRSAACWMASPWRTSAGRERPCCCWWPWPSVIVLLTENARIPVDDPNTHLELTMIHEVMVLDHGGVGLRPSSSTPRA